MPAHGLLVQGLPADKNIQAAFAGDGLAFENGFQVGFQIVGGHQAVVLSGGFRESLSVREGACSVWRDTRDCAAFVYFEVEVQDSQIKT